MNFHFKYKDNQYIFIIFEGYSIKHQPKSAILL